LDKIIKYRNIITSPEHKDWDGLAILKESMKRNGQGNTLLETISKRPIGRPKTHWEVDVKKIYRS
jgi:hypothetical protein